MPAPLFNRITIIGLGLIGSSIARAAHERGIAGTIIGCDSNELSLAYGIRHGFLNAAESNPAVAVAQSQLVILASPPSTLGDIAFAIAPKLAPGTLVMDVCSVKRAAIEAIAPHMPAHVHFVPAHPIAGSEQSGINAGRADLFDGKRIIITPPAPLQGELLQTVNDFWERMGARVEGMPAHLHDMVYAYVSHLPQLLAFACAPLLPSPSGRGQGEGVSKNYEPVEGPSPHPLPEGEGETLRRFLRISNSDPTLWSELFYLNKDNIINVLDDYLNVISHIHDELTEAPDDAPNKADDTIARTKLFPRIAASCLITTVMNAEKKAGFPFARYAGTGFADFTSPAMAQPDDEIEQISNQSLAVRPVLRQFIDELKRQRTIIDSQ